MLNRCIPVFALTVGAVFSFACQKQGPPPAQGPVPPVAPAPVPASTVVPAQGPPPTPVPAPTVAPARPVSGEQIIVKLKGGRPCVGEVELAVRRWAFGRQVSVRVNFISEKAIDVELLPHPSQLLFEAYPLDERVQRFESECMLFQRRYRDNRLLIVRLRGYVKNIGLMPGEVSEMRLAKLGFTTDDASHLRSHLGIFVMDRTYYGGIRYFRVTYSVSPNAEFTINTGTVQGHIISNWERQGINSLLETVRDASNCAPTE